MKPSCSKIGAYYEVQEIKSSDVGNAMEGCLFKSAQKELDIQVRRDKWVEESDIKNLTYLQAIVKETLRMYPPGPLGAPHEAIEDSDIGDIISGRRMCPATTFALRVVHLTLARLLQGFDLSTPMGKPVDMTEGFGQSLPKVKPIEVIITARLPPELYQNPQSHES
ncbi:cytochrome P450 [Tanacetum coccineum]